MKIVEKVQVKSDTFLCMEGFSKANEEHPVNFVGSEMQCLIERGFVTTCQAKKGRGRKRKVKNMVLFMQYSWPALGIYRKDGILQPYSSTELYHRTASIS